MSNASAPVIEAALEAIQQAYSNPAETFHYKDVAALIEINEPTVSAALCRLAERHLITRVGAGAYQNRTPRRTESDVVDRRAARRGETVELPPVSAPQEKSDVVSRTFEVFRVKADGRVLLIAEDGELWVASRVEL